MDDSKTKIIQAHRLEIVDDQGFTRIRLYTKNEASIIEFCNSNGKPNLELEVNDSQSGICLRDVEGEVRTFIGVANGQPGLCFYSPGGQRVFEIYMDYNRGLVIGFYDTMGRHRFTITFDFLVSNGSIIELFDEMYKNRIIFSLINNEPNIAFHDEFGRRRLILGFGQRRSIGIWLNDLHEKPQIIIAADYDGIPKIWLYGENINNAK